MLITKPFQMFSDPEAQTTLSLPNLERVVLTRNLIPQEELYNYVWAFVQTWNSVYSTNQIDFIETFRTLECALLEKEDEFRNNYIMNGNDLIVPIYRKNLNADVIDQIFDVPTGEVCWYEEFGFYEIGNYLFSRSIVVLQDSNFEVVLVIPKTKEIDLEFFVKNYTPTMTSGFLIEGFGRLESRSVKSHLRDLMAKDEFLSSKVALVLQVPDVDRDDS